MQLNHVKFICQHYDAMRMKLPLEKQNGAAKHTTQVSIAKLNFFLSC